MSGEHINVKTPKRFNCTGLHRHLHAMGALVLVIFVVTDLYADVGLSLTRCPWGAKKKGAAPPDAFEEWCEKENKDGLPVKHGLFKAWYETGEIEITGQYWWGRPVKTWYFWHKNHKIKAEVNYKWGKKEGLARSWHDNGQLESKIQFKDNIPEGIWERWFATGVMKTRVEHVSWIDKTLTAWDTEGNKRATGKFRNNVSEGEWAFWHFNGVMFSRGRVDAGDLRGEWPYWHPNGEKGGTCVFKGRLDRVLEHEACRSLVTSFELFSEDIPVVNAPEGQ